MFYRCCNVADICVEMTRNVVSFERTQAPPSASCVMTVISPHLQVGTGRDVGKLWVASIQLSPCVLICYTQKLVRPCYYSAVTSNSGVESRAITWSKKITYGQNYPWESLKRPIKCSTLLSLKKFFSASFPSSVGTDHIYIIFLSWAPGEAVGLYLWAMLNEKYWSFNSKWHLAWWDTHTKGAPRNRGQGWTPRPFWLHTCAGQVELYTFVFFWATLWACLRLFRRP